MSIPQKIIKFLDVLKIKYEPIEHRKVFTAFDKAQTLKAPEKIIGKTLVVKLDKDYGLILVPANKNLDKKKLLQIANKWQNSKCLTPDVKHKIRSIGFVNEIWMKKNIKGVKLGAIPPFGTLWKLPTFIDKSLLNQSKIIVNGGDWNWSIRINPAVFKKTIPDSTTGSFIKAR